MKTVIILMGCPGSGKSTYAKTNYPDYVYINQDRQGKQHLKDFKKAISMGLNVVVDRMNFNKEQRQRYIKPAKELGYKTIIVRLLTPVNVCKERIKLRQNHETIKTEEDMNNAINFWIKNYTEPQEDEADEIESIL